MCLTFITPWPQARSTSAVKEHVVCGAYSAILLHGRMHLPAAPLGRAPFNPSNMQGSCATAVPPGVPQFLRHDALKEAAASWQPPLDVAGPMMPLWKSLAALLAPLLHQVSERIRAQSRSVRKREIGRTSLHPESTQPRLFIHAVMCRTLHCGLGTLP